MLDPGGLAVGLEGICGRGREGAGNLQLLSDWAERFIGYESCQEAIIFQIFLAGGEVCGRIVE